MKNFTAFILGMIEFRSCYCTHFTDYRAMLSYDAGREFAHKVTFRRFEQ